MVNYRFALVGFAGLAAALPLNINLGAYSPALVVGDGEISFSGGEEVTSILAALEGAAQSGKKTAGAAGIASAPGVAAAAVPQVPAVSQPETVSIANVPTTPVVDASAVNPALEQQAQQIAALQGMGKAIAPRNDAEDEAEDEAYDGDDDANDLDVETGEDESEDPVVAKRDLASFQAALEFATTALTKGPIIQLGTGKAGGAGVGIVVNNNPVTGTGKAKTKRDLGNNQRVKVTTMYVRSGIPALLRSSPEIFARDASPLVFDVPIPDIFSRSDSPLDSVNLNVDGDTGLTMTFVETIPEGDDDDE